MQGLSKSMRLKGASKKPVLALRLRKQHPAPAVTRRKIPFLAKPESPTSCCPETAEPLSNTCKECAASTKKHSQNVSVFWSYY